MGVRGQRHAPAAPYPRERPIVQEAGWASGPVWTGAENLAPPGFDPRTAQPVGSRYTDYATRPIKPWNLLKNKAVSEIWKRWIEECCHCLIFCL